jgi:hypothetical protein
VYFGHFGARTKTQRYKSTPLYASWYKDYSSWSPEKLAAQGWPKDQKLRERGLYGGGDDMDWLAPGAVAGTYFDEVHLNKRVGHFLRLILAYFGSMHLGDSRNTFNLEPTSVRAGDVLVERWQRSGIGHTLVVKEMRPLGAGQLEVEVVSGSMPRRQPKWEDPVATKSYFVNNYTGGVGEAANGEPYAALGGGLKRFRVTKNIGGYWTNTWMAEDESSWISDSDHAAIAARPAIFGQILGEASPDQNRSSLLAMIEDKRNHLRNYPASCSARERREEAFDELYVLMQDHFATTPAETDAQYRIFEDYVFTELDYPLSKTCCWNSTTAAMFQIVMDYNASLQQNQCVEPVVFRCHDGGYQVFADYAAATGRAALWKPWSEDETCAQRDVQNDTELGGAQVAFCGLGDGGPVAPGGCSDDGYEDNDSASAASLVSEGAHAGLMVCSGDDDHYRIDVPAGGALSVTVSFDHADGDIDVSLHQGGAEIASSASVGNVEKVTAQGGGSYWLRIYGYQGAQAAYALDIAY